MTTDIAVRGPMENGGKGTNANGTIGADFGQNNEEYDDNSSSRLFERHRIKALAGRLI
jgi:hypothetical protein